MTSNCKYCNRELLIEDGWFCSAKCEKKEQRNIYREIKFMMVYYLVVAFLIFLIAIMNYFDTKTQIYHMLDMIRIINSIMILYFVSYAAIIIYDIRRKE